MSFDFTVRTKRDLIDAVRAFGFVPLFRNSIPGFSVAEHVVPEVWFSDENEGVWEWKGPVIRESRCAYGKFFETKAVFISGEWFPDFANYRRDGYDFDARFDEGLAPYADNYLFGLVDSNAPVLSKYLKQIGDYRKGGRKGFDTSMNRLQSQCYVVISDFRYMTDRYGKQYGWGVAEYSTPEKLLGAGFTDSVYKKEPEESYERVFRHLKDLLPDVSDDKIKRLLQ